MRPNRLAATRLAPYSRFAPRNGRRLPLGFWDLRHNSKKAPSLTKGLVKQRNRFTHRQRKVRNGRRHPEGKGRKEARCLRKLSDGAMGRRLFGQVVLKAECFADRLNARNQVHRFGGIPKRRRVPAISLVWHYSYIPRENASSSRECQCDPLYTVQVLWQSFVLCQDQTESASSRQS